MEETLDERKKTLDKMEESGRISENKREAQRKKKEMEESGRR